MQCYTLINDFKCDKPGHLAGSCLDCPLPCVDPEAHIFDCPYVAKFLYVPRPNPQENKEKWSFLLQDCPHCENSNHPQCLCPNRPVDTCLCKYTIRPNQVPLTATMGPKN